jgi:hypothetical protein
MDVAKLSSRIHEFASQIIPVMYPDKILTYQSAAVLLRLVQCGLCGSGFGVFQFKKVTGRAFRLEGGLQIDIHIAVGADFILAVKGGWASHQRT